MGPLVVIIKPMIFSDSTGMSYAHEPVQIQAFIPELAVEAFHIGVIDRLPRANEMKLYPALICPCIQSVADKLGTVVHDNVFREPPNSCYLT
jgi:hypothetical protein